MSLSVLPDGVLSEIFGHVSPGTLLKISLVSARGSCGANVIASYMHAAQSIPSICCVRHLHACLCRSVNALLQLVSLTFRYTAQRTDGQHPACPEASQQYLITFPKGLSTGACTLFGQVSYMIRLTSVPKACLYRRHACISCGEFGEFPVRSGNLGGTKLAPVAFLICKRCA